MFSSLDDCDPAKKASTVLKRMLTVDIDVKIVGPWALIIP